MTNMTSHACNATSAAAPRPPGFVASSLRIFDLSLGEMLWSRRTIFMALVVGAPVLIALILRLLVGLGAPFFDEPRGGGAVDPDDRPGHVRVDDLAACTSGSSCPCSACSTGRPSWPTRSKTRRLRICSRGRFPAGRSSSASTSPTSACTVFVVLPSVVLVYLLIVPLKGSLGAAFPDLLKDLLLLGLGLAVYGAVFAFVGAKFKRPLLIGLIFVFGWEQAALAFPGYLKQFTVAVLPPGHRPPRHAERRGRQHDSGDFPGDPRAADQFVLAGGDLGRFSGLGRQNRGAQGIRAGAVGSGSRL